MISLMVSAAQAPSLKATPACVLQSSQGASSSSPETEKRAKRAADKTAKQDTPLPTASVSDGLAYRIGADDELQISVWREPELSTLVVVRPDGMITLPLLNDVRVVGLKTEELQSLLAEKLGGFVNEPQVTVIVRAIRSRKVSLFGNVVRQGTYPLGGGMTVLGLLAAAGGLGPFAKADSIYILREQQGKKLRIPFHYKKAVAGKEEDTVIYPGDVVVVP